jgi:putative ATPase
VADLFSHHRETQLAQLAPLADRMRPRSLEEFQGQEAILGPGRLLRRAIQADRVGNLILHGPPGVGKTTLARIIAATTRAHFSSLNAVLAGVKDLRSEVDAAKRRLEQHSLRTLLFIDEVHRFNSAQQDALLPWVENGTVTLIGATTENPYFEVNKALVSRSRLFRMEPLEAAHLHALLQRALADPERGYGQRRIEITAEAAAHLVDVAGGDARSLLNALELAVETTAPVPLGEPNQVTDPEPGPPTGDPAGKPAGEQAAKPSGSGAAPAGVIRIDLAIAEESIQQRAVLYDKQGDAHFDTISAFIKSLRGSDADAALFWLARMVEAGENPRFIFRRMLISAGEDIGLADPQAVVVVEACAAAFERVGLPEGLYPLAQAALYLASTEKSNSLLGFLDALKTVKASNRQEVPSHLRDANRDGQAFGDGVGYRYPHAYAEHWVAQQYLPSALQGELFWQPGQLGWEGERRARMQQRRAAQLAAAAEQEAEQGTVLSGGPEDPLLNRWLQRQLASEGQRLDQLRQRLWQDTAPRRQDRALILEARSLLWALDPLAACPEGGVVIQLAQGKDLQQLQAQLQVLDSLIQPQLIAPEAPPAQARAPKALQEQMPEPTEAPGDLDPAGLQALIRQLEPGHQFEWIAGRHPFRALSGNGLLAAVAGLDGLAAPRCTLRLLFSSPALGPAGALLASGRPLAGAEKPMVLAAAACEQAAFTAQVVGPDLGGLDRTLQGHGWTVTWQRWPETLELEIGEALLGRWFGPQAAYRQQLQTSLSLQEIDALAQLLRGLLGQRLPQRLQHELLIAQRRPSA